MLANYNKTGELFIKCPHQFLFVKSFWFMTYKTNSIPIGLSEVGDSK